MHRRCAKDGYAHLFTQTLSPNEEPFDDPVAAIGELGPRDVVLVKASRAAGLERVVADLLAP